MPYTRSQTTKLVAQTVGSDVYIIDTSNCSSTTPVYHAVDACPGLLTDAAYTFLAFNRDGTLLAAGTTDMTTTVWRIADGVCTVSLAGHSQPVTSASFSPSNTLLATASLDCTAKLWHIDSGLSTATCSGHTKCVISIAFSPSGTMLATGSADNTAKLWLVASGECISTLAGHTDTVTSVAFSRDGILLATGSCDMTAKIWSVAADECITTLAGHRGAVACIAFSADDKTIVTGSADATAKLWRTGDWVCTATLAGHSGPVTCAELDSDGMLVATSSGRDRTTKLWRVADGVCTTLEVQSGKLTSATVNPQIDPNSQVCCANDNGVCVGTVTGHTDAVTSVVFSPDGRLIATGGWDSVTKLWRVSDVTCLATLVGHTATVTSVAFSPNGTLLATGSWDNTTKLWRVADGVCTATLAGHRDMVTSIAFSPDGTLIASSSQDMKTKLWRVADGVCTANLAGHIYTVTSVAFCPDGKLLATGSHDKTARLWFVADGTCAATLTSHSRTVTSVAFGPDGTLLATGSEDTTVKLWDVARGACTATFAGHSSAVRSVAFKSNFVLVTGSGDKTSKFWRIDESGVVCFATLQGHTASVTSVSLSPDGMLLATASYDKTAKLWRVGDKRAEVMTSPTTCASAVAFVDGSLLTAGGEDKKNYLWWLSAGACIATLRVGHISPVTCVAFGFDDRLLATGSACAKTKLWRIADGVCISTLLSGHCERVMAITFSADGSLVASMYADGLCLIWSVEKRLMLGKTNLNVANSEAIQPILRFDFSDDQCAVLEYRCEDRMTQFTVGLRTVDDNEVPVIDAQKANASQNHASLRETKMHSRLRSFPRTRMSDIVVGACIGGGSSSIVHHATWRGRGYALKLYHRFVVSAIAREIAVAPFLRHPNIVRVVTIVVDDNGETVGLLMELASNSLSPVLSLQPRPTDGTILKWLHGVAQGLEFAHACGVVHSDIKPDNIMLFGEDAKLTDFGSASTLSTVSLMTTTVRGTPLFIAPEYASGETGPTKASDVFSFGMTMWCAFGPPGTEHGLGKTPIQVAIALHSGRRPPLTILDATFVQLIERCWAADPSMRPPMTDVEESLRHLRQCATPTATSSDVPSTELWSTFLRSYEIERALGELRFHREHKMFFSDPITDPTNRCHQFISSLAGSLRGAIKRVVMVGTDAARINAFITQHEAEGESRALNPALRRENLTDAASVAGLNRLKRSFVPVETAAGEPLPLARLVFAWHGTPSAHVTPVCRDGPRSLRTTDSGYFGAGSYFALEASYASRYSSPDFSTDERAVILFAVSVSHVKVITPERDYRLIEDPDTPHLNGLSNYYSGNPNTAVALAPGCDAHFIPVKDYGFIHPLTGQILPRDVSYQAVDVSTGMAEAHELVIASHHRCLPVAVVYLT